MKSYPLIVVLFFVCHLCAESQVLYHIPERHDIDSINLLNKKKRLSILKGINRIDMLNSISEDFFYTGYTIGLNDKQRTDSILHYAQLANNEANKSGYRKGILNSLLHLTSGELTRSRMPAAEKYVQQIISDKNSDDQSMAKAYFLLSVIQYEGHRQFQNAVNSLKQALYHSQKANDEKTKGFAFAGLGLLYLNQGEYEKAFDPIRESVKIARLLSDRPGFDVAAYFLVLRSYQYIITLYKSAGDYGTALEYLHQLLQYSASNNNKANMDV